MTTSNFPDFDTDEAKILYSDLLGKYLCFEQPTPQEHEFMLQYASYRLQLKLSKPETLNVLKRLKDK